MNTFELSNEPELSGTTSNPDRKGLDNSVLLNNARWFARIRWFIISLFLSAGLSGLLLPEFMKNLGVHPPLGWPWMLAGILIPANICFLLMAGKLNSNSPRNSIEINIWLQIIADLIVVTILVHIIGSTRTFIPFTYLFHIALACIFFPPRNSLLVTIIAAAMYLVCVALEITGIWPATCIFVNIQDFPGQIQTVTLMMAVSAVFMWFVIWYLISTLSEFVRERDVQLDMLNRELIKADREKNRLMLQTTHDLKAPFSGIESNIQMLRFKHWDEMSEPVRGIVERIEIRAETLRERIRDMLLLGELRSQTSGSAPNTAVDLKPVINSVVEELFDKAAQRKISITVDIPEIAVVTHDKQLRILLLNLISNAILYSRDEGKVIISAKQQTGGVVVSITDNGIGIKAEALPRIFDEYYRTKEAADFNKLSTGLGLAIVRQIALTLNYGIKVTSTENVGTSFEVTIRN